MRALGYRFLCFKDRGAINQRKCAPQTCVDVIAAVYNPITKCHSWQKDRVPVYLLNGKYHSLDPAESPQVKPVEKVK